MVAAAVLVGFDCHIVERIVERIGRIERIAEHIAHTAGRIVAGLVVSTVVASANTLVTVVDVVGRPCVTENHIDFLIHFLRGSLQVGHKKSFPLMSRSWTFQADRKLRKNRPLSGRSWTFLVGRTVLTVSCPDVRHMWSVPHRGRLRTRGRQFDLQSDGVLPLQQQQTL